MSSSSYMTTHQIQEAKQRFSAVAEQAANGHPQLVTKHGKPFVVVVGAKEWGKSRGQVRGVMDALRACPSSLHELKISRSNDFPRRLTL